MEAVGAGTALITLTEIALKVRKLQQKIKNAPKELETYCESMDNIQWLQETLRDQIKSNGFLSDITITPDDGHSLGLVEYSNRHLERVRNHAEDLLQQHKGRAGSKASRIMAWLARLLAKIEFVLNEEDLRDRIRQIENTKSSLMFALNIAHAASTTLGYTNIQTKLQETADQISQLFMQELGNLEIRMESPWPEHPTTQNIILQLPPSQIITKTRKRQLGKRNKKTSRVRNHGSGVVDGSTLSTSSAEYQSLKNVMNEKFPDQRERNERSSEIIDNLLPIAGVQGPCTALTLELTEENNRKAESPPPDPADDIVALNSNSWSTEGIVIATNSDDVESNFDANADDDAGQGHYRLRHDEWEEDVESDPADFESMHEADSSSTSSVTEVRLKDKAKAFISSAVAIGGNSSNTEKGFSFCIEHIHCDAENQVFTLKGRCKNSDQCNHCRIEILRSEIIQHPVSGHIPILLTPATPDPSPSPKANCGSNDYELLRFERGYTTEDRHLCTSVVLDLQQVWYASQADFHAIPANPLREPGSECLPPPAQMDGHHILPETPELDAIYQRLNQEANAAGKTISDEYEGRVLCFVRSILRERKEEIPTQVDLTTVFHAAVIAHNCHLRTELDDQIRKWIERILPDMPDSLTDELLPWIWITWAYGFDREFKVLTAVAQKETSCRIDRDNAYRVSLPTPIVDAIQNRRLRAISHVRSFFVQVIENYKAAASFNEPAYHSLDRLRYKLIADYLDEEARQCGFDLDQSQLIKEFEGVKFRDVLRRISEMEDPTELRDTGTNWNLLYDRMTPFLIMGGLIFPRIFSYWTCNTERIQFALHECFRQLAESLESEEWGLDLHEFQTQESE